MSDLAAGRYSAAEIAAIEYDRDYWSEIGSLFGEELLAFTKRSSAVFTGDLRIEDSRVAEMLHLCVELSLQERVRNQS